MNRTRLDLVCTNPACGHVQENIWIPVADARNKVYPPCSQCGSATTWQPAAPPRSSKTPNLNGSGVPVFINWPEE